MFFPNYRFCVLLYYVQVNASLLGVQINLYLEPRHHHFMSTNTLDHTIPHPFYPPVYISSSRGSSGSTCDISCLPSPHSPFFHTYCPSRRHHVNCTHHNSLTTVSTVPHLHSPTTHLLTFPSPLPATHPNAISPSSYNILRRMDPASDEGSYATQLPG